MKLEIPEPKKCCFCLPLRHSLIAWGCFKMLAEVDSSIIKAKAQGQPAKLKCSFIFCNLQTADAFLITALSISMAQVVLMVKVLDSDDDILSMIAAELIIPVIAFAVLIVDFVMTLTFVFGGLEKNLKLTELFYFISIAMWIFSLLVTATFVVIAVQSATDNLEVAFSFYFLNLVVQAYFLILLRSEIIKLKNVGESRSQNNAAEAESTKKCEEIVTGVEDGKEVV